MYTCSELLTVKALFGAWTATVDPLLTAGCHVSSRPEDEREGSDCEDSEKGKSSDVEESGNAHGEGHCFSRGTGKTINRLWEIVLLFGLSR